MRFRQDSQGRWSVVRTQPVALSEALYGCKQVGADVDRRTEKEDGRERAKAKVSKDWDCYIGEDEEEENLTEDQFSPDEVDNYDRLFAEIEDVVLQARAAQDENVLADIRARFERFLPAVSSEKPENEPVNERHRERWEARKRLQRTLKSRILYHR